MKRNPEAIKAERRMILEMIDASWDLAEQLGKHPVKKACNCIACVNKRKRLLDKQNKGWRFEL
ncbi:MAG: hypothetical protein ABIG67_11295 [Pseudomonadota bacterium]